MAVQMSELKAISESDGELQWLPTSAFHRDCVLVSRGEVYARLRWQQAFRALAVATTHSGEWSFTLEGFLLRQWVRIRREGESEAIAVFQAQPSFNGVLEFGDGRAFYWDSNFWLTKWLWCDGDGMERLRMNRHLTLRTEGSLFVAQECLTLDETPLLVVLGWYLIQIVTDLRVG